MPRPDPSGTGRRRERSPRIWGGVTGLGVAAGPVVGGAITEGLSWQWIFWVNVPIGLLVAFSALGALRRTSGSVRVAGVEGGGRGVTSSG